MARRRIVRPGGDHGCRKSHRPAVFHFFKIILSSTSEQNKLCVETEDIKSEKQDLVEVEIQENKPSVVLNSVISPPSSHSFNSKVPEARAKKRETSEASTKPEQKITVKESRGSASMTCPDFEKIHTRNKRPKVERLDEMIDIDDNETIRKNTQKDKLLVKNRAKCESSKTKSMGECKDQEAEIVSCKIYQCSRGTPNSERAIAAAKKYIPKGPSFMVILRESICDRARVYVPGRFVPYLNDAPNFVKLRVSDGREWEVQLVREGCRRIIIGSGWRLFMNDNNLDVGDVCVFELMKNKEVLEVSIFRATEDVKLEH